MKKLLQINIVSDIASTGRITAQLLQYAEYKYFEPLMAYGVGKSTFKNKYRISSNWFSLHFHGFLGRKLGLIGYFSYLDTWRLIRWMKKVNPDVIHLHNLHGAYLNFRILFNYLRKSKKQIIWTLHDCWAFTGGCSHFTTYNCYKWMNGCKDCKFLKKIYKGNIYGNTAFVLTDKKKVFCGLPNMQIFAVSKWLANEANQSILKEYNVQVIYNGIDTSVFKPVKTDLKKQLGIEEHFMILGVANIWGEKKGFNKFLELSEELTDDFIIVLIGLSDFQKKILPKNIIGISRTNDINRLVEFYSAADALINFSSEETFGLTVAESLACGTPAIVMNSTACPELIDYKTGFVIENGNIYETIDSLKKIKYHGNDFYTQNCIERCNKNFSMDLMLKRYLIEYERAR